VKFRRLYLLLPLIVLLLFTHVTSVHAVCPVCTVAVGVGLGVSRYLGIDDSVTGIWVGGLLCSSGFWMAQWLYKRNVKLPYLPLICILLLDILTFPPLYLAGMIGHKGNALWGVAKLVLGSIIGSILFIGSVIFETYLRMKNNQKTYLPYQKVIVPVALLSFFSILFYIITKR
jgi:hypothetical protein